MAEIIALARFTVPLGQQEIEVQQIEHTEGGMPLMRLRIREGKRFTIFDIDPVTARELGAVLQHWSATQGG
ncbi:MAG: hypothetical protein KGK17_02695 [Betaproteobacteria bacterium]|nr:hypothetical protein [Betaproteobacteria bacterium]